MTTHAYFASPEVYDRMYAKFVADVPVFVEEARSANGPVLEVCCGNGRLLVPIREAGVDIDGLDLDEPMLATLRERLAARGLTASLHQGDMRDFALPRRYALVFIGFNTIAHNLTQADQIRTLETCRDHLAPGGCFVMSLFHPSAARLAAFDGSPRMGTEYDAPDGSHTTMWDATVADRVEQVNHVRRTFERRDRDGQIIERGEYPFDLRYIFKPEMELLLRVAGFTRWEVTSRISGYQGEVYPEPHPPEDGGILHWRAWCE